MPIYEFYSPDTHRIYSFFARSLAQGRRVPRCPDDPAARMERMVSSFAVTGRNRDQFLPGESPLETADPGTEAAMAAMEREMASLNPDNPDPRQLAHLMRTMGEASGKPLPDTMRSMIQRLEHGEDPEKIEQEMANAWGDWEATTGAESEPSSPRHRPAAPTRDPALHEMADYLDSENP